MRRKTYWLLLLLLLITPMLAQAQKKERKVHTIHLTVKDKDSKEAIIMASVQLQPSGILAVTNADGQATLRNVEEGMYTLLVSYVGYESQNIRVKVEKLDNKQ